MFAVVGALFGAMGWAVGARERYLTMRIEGIADSLTDRALLEDLFDEITADTAWTRQELRSSIGSWIEESRASTLPRWRAAIPPTANRWQQAFLEIDVRMSEVYDRWLGTVGIRPPPERDEAFWTMAVEIGITDFADVALAKAFESGAVERVLSRMPPALAVTVTVERWSKQAECLRPRLRRPPAAAPSAGVSVAARMPREPGAAMPPATRLSR